MYSLPSVDDPTAAPQPSTKHLTDEELKQQYGIHMTSRIQADGDGKEAKWADIDDDEDDWAPETIEWGDGTKVTVNQADPLPLALLNGKPEILTADGREPAQPLKIISPHAVSSIGPNATILKVGANAERQQAQKAAILQKGPTERSTSLSTKAPAPVPSKSPWAALPPVDKLSPIAINPQMAMPAPTRYFTHQGSAQSPSGLTMHSPAKEISADDFNRSWRDPPVGQTRELYMPNSGKYEAVNEGRRRSSRNDQHFRAPAVLQRPNVSDQHGPAEPSAAFQTHRSSNEQERAPWARRRASSNISGASGQFGRRMSVTKPSDFSAMPNEVLQERRASHATGTDSVDSSRDMPPPQLQTSSHMGRGPSPAYAVPRHSVSSGDHDQPNAPQMQSDIETEKTLQRQLMKEKRELAVKRKRDEEERMEAEKRERIRLKLEALGPPPEKTKPQDAPVDNIDKHIRPVEATPAAQSPPKPPTLEASGEPKQYGMMKIHPPEAPKKALLPSQRIEASILATPSSDVSHRTSDPLPNATLASPAMTNGLPTEPESRGERLSENPAFSDKPAPNLKGNSLGMESRSAWGSSRVDPRSPPSTSVWGPLSNNKALGNGTFDQSLAGFPSRDFVTRDPSWANGHPVPPERSPQPAYAANQAPAARAQSVPSVAASEQSLLAANSEADSVYPHAKPAPIGPPQSQHAGHRWQPSPTMRHANAVVAGWNDFPNVAAREDRAETERLQHELAARLEEEARTGVRKTPHYTFNETWKQVELGDQAGQRQITSTTHSTFNSSISAAHQFGAVGSLPSAESGPRTVNGMPSRGSRFFPHMGEGIPSQTRRAVTYSHPETSRSPSAPPAEEYGSPHSLFNGDDRRPVVQLPPQKPVVKLPPPRSATPPHQTAPLSFAAALASQPQSLSLSQPQPQPLPPLHPQSSLRVVSTPIAATISWQDRFNGLLGTKTSQEKKNVLAVTSSTREPLDVLPLQVSASVSLPQKEDDVLKDAGKVASKDVEDEEEMFEDREAGSLPLVKIPLNAPAAAWHPARVPLSRPKSRYPPKLEEPFTVWPWMLEFIEEHSQIGQKHKFALIRLPGATTSIKKDLPRQGGTPNSAASISSSRNSSTNFNNKHRKGGTKSREGSMAQSQPHQTGKNIHVQSPLPNGNMSSPRSGLPNHNGWRGNRAAAGVAR